MVLSGARVEEELYLAAGSEDEDSTTIGKGRRELGLGIGAGLEEGKCGIGWKFANQGIDSPHYSYAKRNAHVAQNRDQSPLPRSR
jgi:hypothetical protein